MPSVSFFLYFYNTTNIVFYVMNSFCTFIWAICATGVKLLLKRCLCTRVCVYVFIIFPYLCLCVYIHIYPYFKICMYIYMLYILFILAWVIAKSLIVKTYTHMCVCQYKHVYNIFSILVDIPYIAYIYMYLHSTCVHKYIYISTHYLCICIILWIIRMEKLSQREHICTYRSIYVHTILIDTVKLPFKTIIWSYNSKSNCFLTTLLFHFLFARLVIILICFCLHVFTNKWDWVSFICFLTIYIYTIN